MELQKYKNSKLQKILEKQAFTLVELIIVIAIIAVLAVAAFMMLTKWLGKSRDSKRLGDLETINNSLWVWLVDTDNTTGTLPLPDEAVEISYSGNVIWYQWKYWETVIKTIANIAKVPLDPSDSTKYTYRTNKSKKKYELYGLLEGNTAFLWNEILALDYSNRKVVTKWYMLWVLTNDNKVPIEDIESIWSEMELKWLTENYMAWIDSTHVLEWDGSRLEDLKRVDRNDFGNPPDSCPDWFIPVVGNLDFIQPWFCVAKYEMSYEGWERWLQTRETTIYDDTDANGDGIADKNVYIVSKAWELAITSISQQEAMDACASMWEGYHLITNSEWMTIARSIEAQPNNWSSGVVWSGHIWNGVSNTSFWCDGWASDPTAWDGSYAEPTGSNCGSEQRNKFTLSNGEEIWDFAGNVREHVNRGNNPIIDIVQVWEGNLCNSSWYWYQNGDPSTTCASDYGPIHNWTNGYTTDTWMWYVRNTDLADKIFIRGGWARRGQAAIYSLSLARGGNYKGNDIGFRCAK